MATTLPLSWDVPAVEPAEVAAFVNRVFGLSGPLTPLPGERDRNFRLDAADGRQYVVKVAHASESADVLALQHAALEHIARHAPDLTLPRPTRTRAGEDTSVLVAAGGVAHRVRVLTWVPGVPLAQVKPRAAESLDSVGELLGRMDAALASFDHPGAHRPLKWDLAHASWIVEHTQRIAGAERRALAERLFRPYLEQVLPVWDRLPAGIIHNDANDHNVLLAESPVPPRAAVAIIDYGDMVWTASVADVAIAAAYAMLDLPDPLAAAARIVAGYHQARPLSDAELAALYPLICARLVVSVVNAALQRDAAPDHAYLQVSAAPVWALLERLAGVQVRFAHYRLRQACGMTPCPPGERVKRWFETGPRTVVPVLDVPADRLLPRIDLSVGSELLDDARLAADEPRLSRRIARRLAEAGAVAGIGEYDEPRLVYTTDAFRVEGRDGPEWRTVHIGLDVFAAPGTTVRAPLAGRVHALRDNAAPLDYGPTVILEHEASDDAGGFTFFTLYGHLDRSTLGFLQVGDGLAAGDTIGRIGEAAVNGGWSPHLHVQVIADLLDRDGEFPGVARPAEREVWTSICPPPYAFCRLPYTAAPAAPPMGALLERRRAHLGGNLSIAYQKPLHIVRGFMQHLYDVEGRRYLDAVNNVPHVGHSHPRVVEAGRRQMAVLNTNTRYLHESVLRYAERLCATLPEPLRVAYFVNSGSEANELALRLARTHTGRPGTIVLDGAYHGNTATLVALSPYKCEGPGGAGLAPGARKLPLPDRYRGIYRGAVTTLGARYAAHAQDAADQLAEAGSPVGAFLCESVLSCGGQIVLPPGYLAHVYSTVRAAGAVTIADEVQTGFGRVGSHFWGFQTQAVVPDIVVMGKPAGNGHPLGIVVTTPDIAASFANGMEYFSTFGGNPVSCAIGLAVLDVIADEGLQQNAHAVGAYLLSGLQALVSRHEAAGDARGLGLFAGLELVRDRTTRLPHAAAATYIANRLREKGILVSTDGPDHNVLKIKPPLCFTDADADQLIAALDEVLTEDAAQAS